MAKLNVFSDVLEEYKQNKIKAENTLEKRKKEIYIKIPEIEKIHKELYETGFKITKNILTNKDNADALLEELREHNDLLILKEKYILKENGYEEDYLTIKYKCSLCNDSGYVGGDKCQCLKQRLITKYYDMSGIKEVLQKENFDNFDIRFYSDEKDTDGISPKKNIQSIYKIALKFVQNFPHEFKNILFYGSTGLGKTFMCNCIAKDILDNGYTVLYVTAPDIFKTLEDYRFNRESMTNPEYYISMLTTVDLLIIDDLGTEVATIVTSSELFNMINTRYIKNKHTIISTNLAPQELESIYSHRLESRFIGHYDAIKFSGDDIRIMKKYGVRG